MSALFAASWTYYTRLWPTWLMQTLSPGRPIALARANQAFFLDIGALPQIHLHAVLSVQLLLFSHVQIALRQVLTDPVPFWFLAYLYKKSHRNSLHTAIVCAVGAAIVFVPLWTAFYPPA